MSWENRRNGCAFQIHTKTILSSNPEGIPNQSIFHFQSHHTIPLGRQQKHMCQSSITFRYTPASPQAMSETSLRHPPNGLRPSLKPARSSIWWSNSGRSGLKNISTTRKTHIIIIFLSCYFTDWDFFCNFAWICEMNRHSCWSHAHSASIA